VPRWESRLALRTKLRYDYRGGKGTGVMATIQKERAAGAEKEEAIHKKGWEKKKISVHLRHHKNVLTRGMSGRRQGRGANPQGEEPIWGPARGDKGEKVKGATTAQAKLGNRNPGLQKLSGDGKKRTSCEAVPGSTRGEKRGTLPKAARNITKHK